jgi:hypothetical protein
VRRALCPTAQGADGIRSNATARNSTPSGQLVGSWNFRQLIFALQSSSGFCSRGDELEHHQLGGRRRQGSFRPHRPMADKGFLPATYASKSTSPARASGRPSTTRPKRRMAPPWVPRYPLACVAWDSPSKESRRYGLAPAGTVDGAANSKERETSPHTSNYHGQPNDRQTITTTPRAFISRLPSTTTL